MSVEQVADGAHFAQRRSGARTVACRQNLQRNYELMRGVSIGINAQVLPDGRGGGSVRGVVSLVHALTNLSDGDEEYVIISSAINPTWYASGLGRNSKICAHPSLNLDAWYRLPLWLKRYSRPILKPFWNLVGPSLGAATARDAIPKSEFMERLPVELIHYPDQRMCRTSKMSIFSPWDFLHEARPELFSAADLSYRRRLYSAACAYADCIIVPTEWGKNELLSYINVPPRKVRVVPQGVDLRTVQELPTLESDRVRHRLRLPKRFALFPAQTYRHKNHLRMLDAIAELRGQGKLNVKLVCPGYKNEHYAAVERRVEALGLEEDVMFIGFASFSDMEALYQLAEFMVFPTLYEGWGFPIFEAFVRGVPVACSDVTCIRENAGDAVLYFNPQSACEIAKAYHALSEDAGLRASLADKGRARVKEFSWDRSARMHRDVYREVIAGPSIGHACKGAYRGSGLT